MAPPPGDPLWYYKVLGLHCDGANNSTTFTDVKGNTVTANGNAKISTAQYPSLTGKTSSAYFDGAWDYLVFTADSGLNLGTGDFTIRAKVRPSALAEQYFICKVASWATDVDFVLRISSTGYFSFLAGDSVPLSVTSNAVATVNVWADLEVTRSSGVTRMFVDGVLQTSTHTGSVSIPNDATSTYIGAFNGSSEFYSGYISEVEIYKGIALHTASFTPSSDPFQDEYVSVSGTTKDSSGALASRLVRVYRRDTGALVSSVLSNGVTGAYKVIAPDSGTPTPVNLTVVCLDATADPPGSPTENALIYDNLTPI